MTISEAVSLVFQAGALARGGEVFVLDMGQPLPIVTLAEEVIRLNGREPYRDVEISFIGIRPGEKLFEQLLTAEEGTRATRHRKIYTANLNITYQPRDIDRLVAHLRAEIETGGIDNEALRKVLRHYVPTYRPATVVSFPVAQDRPASHNSVRATR
jgi:FlaA1/EpsC-like NDP-sugar epimerase